MKQKLVIVCSLIAVSAHGLLGDSVSGTFDTTVEDSISRSVEQAVAESVDQSVSDAMTDEVSTGVEDGVAESIEQSVTLETESLVENRVTEFVEDEVTTQIFEEVASGVNEFLSDSVASDIGNQVAQDIGDSVAEASTEQAGSLVEENVESAVANAVSLGVDQQITGRIEGRVTGGISRRGQPAGDLNEVVGAALEESEQVLSWLLPVTGASGKTLFYEHEVEDGWKSVYREWLVSLPGGGVDSLNINGIHILEVIEYQALDMTLVRIRVNRNMDSLASLGALGVDVGILDRNHIYDYKPQAKQSAEPVQADTGIEAIRREPLCRAPVRIGMIDSAVNLKHPLLRGSTINQRLFLPEGANIPMDHGSAVAGVLVARGSELSGLIPEASLEVAAVMYQRENQSQGATALDLLSAMEWLAERQVRVVNLSLAGPPNRLIEAAIQRLYDRGVILVASVGNQGPAAPPLFPAAYDGVIGVTAVDRARSVYRWANRGKQVDFAALGVDVTSLGKVDELIVRSGTSLATPVVSAHAACAGVDNNAVTEALAAKAEDLGEPGRDRIFGIGYLH